MLLVVMYFVVFLRFVGFRDFWDSEKDGDHTMDMLRVYFIRFERVSCGVGSGGIGEW